MSPGRSVLVVPFIILLAALPGELGAQERFLRADSSADGQLDIGDPLATLFYLYQGNPLSCLDAADADDSGVIDLSDVIRTLHHLFVSRGVQIPAPGVRSCGFDPTVDDLTCEAYDCPPDFSLVSIARTSPHEFERGVALTRETVIEFSNPVDPVTVTAEAIFAYTGDQIIPTRTPRTSSDGRTVTLFYQEALPAATRVRVVIDGDLVRSSRGLPVDANGDGFSGGLAILEFDTITVHTLSDTAISGRVFASEFDLTPEGEPINYPLGGVTVSVDGSDLAVVTDENGNFRLEPAPAGRFFVHVNGLTVAEAFLPGGSTTPTRFPEGPFYPNVGKAWEGIAGRDLNVGNIYLPLVRPGTLQPVSAATDTTIGFSETILEDFPEFEGVSITVPAGSLYEDDGTPGSLVGIAPVPPDRLPGTLPPRLDFPIVITVQTDGATNFDEPAPVCFPNLPHPETGELLGPGEKSALWSFNHDSGRFEIVGPATVSADGTLVCSDPGHGILAPGWHGVQPGAQGEGGLLEGADDSGCAGGDGPGGGPPPPNGCGPAGFGGIPEALVPEEPIGGISFTPACNNHDSCYATCGSSQDECDEAFHDDMLETCQNEAAAAGVDLEDCMAMASFYAAMVATYGGGAFDSAQVAAGCEENPCQEKRIRQPTFELSTGVHHFAIVELASLEVIQRGETGTEGLAHQHPVTLAANTRYAQVVYHPATGNEGYSEFTTPESGSQFEFPVIRMRPRLSWDLDEDGLSDLGEFILGTGLFDADSDDDGIPDGAEVEQGLDPLDGQPTRTGIIATAPTRAPVVDVAARNELVVVAEGDRGVSVFNVFNGMNPVAIVRLDLPGQTDAVAISGSERLVAAVGTGGLSIIDIADPAEARVVRQLPATDLGGARGQAVAVAGNLAVVGLMNGTLAVVELTSGAVIDQLSVGSRVDDVVIEGRTVYVLTGQELLTLPLEDVGTPFLEVMGSAPSGGNPGRKLFVGEGLAHVTSLPAVYDVTDPRNPGHCSDLSIEGLGLVDIASNGAGTAVAAVGLGLGVVHVQVLDLGFGCDPGTFVTQFTTPGAAADVALYNGLAFVGDGREGLQVIHYLPHDTLGEPPSLGVGVELISGHLEGDEVQEGSLLLVDVDPQDDVQVRKVELLVQGEVEQTDGSFPFQFYYTAPRASETGPDDLVLALRATDTGGNSTLVEIGALDVAPDIFSPTITSAPPEGDLFDRGANREGFTVRFSEPLDPRTVTGENVRLVSAGADGVFGTADDLTIPTSASLTLEGQLLTVLPSEGLPVGPVRLVLEGLTDLAGNLLDGDGNGEPGGSRVQDFTVNRADVQWINPAGGSWHVATNWEPAIVPTSVHVAHIGLDDVVVTVSEPVSIDSLELGRGSPDGPTLLIEGTTLECYQARISSGSTLRVSGLRVIPGAASPATLTVRSTLENHGLLELTEENLPRAHWSPTTVRVVDGMLVNSSTGIVRTLRGGAVPPSVLPRPDVARVIDAAIDSAGTLEFGYPTGLPRGGSTHTNAGTLTLAREVHLLVSGSDLQSPGSIQLDPLTVLTVRGGTLTCTRDLDIPLDTQIVIEDGALAFDTGAPTGPGTLTLLDSLLSISEEFENTLVIELARSEITGAEGIINRGTIHFNGPGCSLQSDITNRGLILSEPGHLQPDSHGTITGTLENLDGASILVRGLRFVPGASNPASLVVVGTLRNHGRIELTEQNGVAFWVRTTLRVREGLLENLAGGTLHTLPGDAPVTDPDEVNPYARTIDAHLTNQGLVDIQFPTTFQREGVEHVNSGRLSIAAGGVCTFLGSDLRGTGTLRMGSGGRLLFERGAFTSSSAFEIPAEALVTITSGSLSFTTGGPTGSGRLLLDRSSLGLSGPHVSSLTLELTRSEISGATTLTNLSTLRLAGPDCEISGNVINRGRLEIDPALNYGPVNATIEGSLRNETGGVVQIHGRRFIPGAIHTARLFVLSGVQNDGLIELTESNSAGEFVFTALVVSGGPLVNSLLGRIRILQGGAFDADPLTRPAAVRHLLAELDNRGRLEIDWNTRLQQEGARHWNRPGSRIDVTGGDLLIEQSGAGANFTNQGTIDIAAESTVRITGGTCTNSGTVTGAGQWEAPCNGLPDPASIQVLGDGIEIANGDTTPAAEDYTDFGSTFLPTPALRPYTIENRGGSALTIASISVDHGPDAEFTVENIPVEPILPGDEATFQVRFQPLTGGEQLATLSIESNDASASPYEFALRAHALSFPQAEIYVLNGIQQVSSGGTIPFGNVAITGASQPRSLAIGNSGNFGSPPLTLSSVRLEGGQASEFSFTSTVPTSVPGGMRRLLEVTFDPTGPGPRSTTLVIESNDADRSPYLLELRGNGLSDPEPDISVQLETLSFSRPIPDGHLSPDSFHGTDFGEVALTGASRGRRFLIVNEGATPLSLGTVSLNGPEAGDFNLIPPIDDSLEPGESTFFTVGFDPSQLGVRQTRVRVPSNDPDEGLFEFAVQGVGIVDPPPEILVSGGPGAGITIPDGSTEPTSDNGTDFGIGATSGGDGTQMRVFRIRNVSYTPVTIGAIEVEDPTEFSLTASPAQELGSVEETTFELTYTPTAIGLRRSQVTIPFFDDAGEEYTHSFTIQGTGVAVPPVVYGGLPPIPIVNGGGTPSEADGTDFGNAMARGRVGGNPVPEEVIRTFIIRNHDLAPLRNVEVEVAGSGSGFILETAPAAEVPPGESTFFRVRFSHQQGGTSHGGVNIEWLDSDFRRQSHRFALSGTNFPLEVYSDFIYQLSGPLPGLSYREPIAHLDLTPRELDGTDFGPAVVDGGKVSREFHLENLRSDIPCWIESFEPSLADYSVKIFPEDGALDPGQDARLEVTFDPIQLGQRRSGLVIRMRDGLQRRYTYVFRIQGTGISFRNPPISVRFGHAGPGDRQVEPGNQNDFRTQNGTDFGDVPVGSSLAHSFLIQHGGSEGDVPIALLGVSLGDDGPFPWRLEEPPEMEFHTGTPRNRAQFRIRFYPAEPGPFETPVFIQTEYETFEFWVRGTAVPPPPDGPRMSVTLEGQPVEDEGPFFNGPSVFLGHEILEGGQTDRTFQIFNDGDTVLSIGTLTIEGNHSTDFSVVQTPSGTVGPGQSTSFVIRFDPTMTGFRLARLLIDSDDPDHSPFHIGLRGHAVLEHGPEIGVDRPQLRFEPPIPAGQVTLEPNTKFDDTPIGQVDLARFSIRNTGSVALDLDAIVIEGEQASSFQLLDDPTGSPNGITSSGVFHSRTLRITFRPQTEGLHLATVRIWNSDSDESPFDFVIHGIGLPESIPDLQVTPGESSVPIPPGSLTPEVANLTDFGSVEIQQSVSHGFRLANRGPAPLLVDSIRLVGGASEDFSILSPPTGPYLSSHSELFHIHFTPRAPGLHSTTVEIESDDPDTPVYTFRIQGMAISLPPDIQVRGWHSNIVNGDSTPTLGDYTFFPSAEVDTGSRSNTFIVRNLGISPLQIEQVEITGPGAADFEIVSGPESQILQGEDSSLRVRFSPTTVGPRRATLRIVSNDPDENPFTFDIEGRGLAAIGPDIQVLGNSIGIQNGDTTPDFGDSTDFLLARVSGERIIRTFVIRNQGTLPLTIQDVRSTGAHASEFTPGLQTPVSVQPGNSVTLPVTFDPSDLLGRQATIEIQSDDPDEGVFTFSVRGVGF